MNIKGLKAVALTGSALALCQAAPSLAQDVSLQPSGTQPAQDEGSARPSEPTAQASEIVVTARRSEERLQDVPISIVVFNQETLTQRNITAADDLARYTPSLASNSRFGPESTNFAIRGFNQEGQTTPSVGIYFADVIGPRAQGGTSGGNGAGVGQFFDLQNVQVLRGPQGTLFGRNTTGGAVLLVPQRPTDRFEGYLEASYGNYNMYRLQGVLNVPLGDQARLRLAVDHQNRDGYLRNRSGIGPDDFNDVNYISLRASLIVDLTPELENYTIVRYAVSDTNGPQYRVVGTNTLANCAPNGSTAGTVGRIGPLVCSQMLPRQIARGDGLLDVENDVPNPYLEINYFAVSNTTTWQISDDVTLRNIASYQEFTQSQTGDPFGANLVVPATFNGVPNQYAGRPFAYINIYTDRGRHNVEQWTATDELQLQGRAAGGALNYQLGAYYEHAGPMGDFQGTRTMLSLSCTDVLAGQCINALGAAGAVGSYSLSRYEFENIGFYGQATYNITDRLAITGGLRYTMDTVEAQGASRTILFNQPNVQSLRCSSALLAANDATNPYNCLVTGRQHSERPTWLVDVDYHITPDILLYAKYSRGYRQGSVNVSNTISFEWQPESVDAYEVGAKLTFRGSIPGYFNIALFYNDLADQQVPASVIPNAGVVGTPAQSIVNAGSSRIQGVEIDASITPFRGFTLTAGYAYLDTELLSVNTAAVSPPPGYTVSASAAVNQDLAFSPHHRLTLDARYTLPLPETVGEISIGASYIYTSTQVAAYFVVAGNPFADPFSVLPETNLVNLNLSWNSIAGSNFDLSLFATNVTDEEYPVAIGNGYFSAGYEYVAVAPPAMYGGRLRFRF